VTAEPPLWRELPPLPQVGLRGAPDDPAFVEAVRAAVGAAPPRAPNTVARAGSAALLWLGPDEWLAVGGDGDLAAPLRAALAGIHSAVVELTASRVVFEIAGGGARDVLAKGCAIDLHPRAFRAGQCAQTGLARGAVILELVDETPRFRIFVRRSFARYLSAWLADAAAGPGRSIP
jgi:sarcosine oxidase, subunit gamma